VQSVGNNTSVNSTGGATPAAVSCKLFSTPPHASVRHKDKFMSFVVVMRLKTQWSIECAICEVRAEVEKTVEHRNCGI